MPVYRRVGADARLQQFKCVEFVEELLYGGLRKEPINPERQGAIMIKQSRNDSFLLALTCFALERLPRSWQSPARSMAIRICRASGPTRRSPRCSDRAGLKQLVLTEQQAARWEAQNADVRQHRRRAGGGLQSGGDVGGYNSFWMDPGTRALRVERRDSQQHLTSPEDGKLPLRLALGPSWENFCARSGRVRRPGTTRLWASAASLASARRAARRCCPCSTTTTIRSCNRPAT